MTPRFPRTSIALFIALGVCFLFAQSAAEAQVKTTIKQRQLRGTVLSVTADSLTIAVHQKKSKRSAKGKSKSPKLTLSCDGRTRVMLRLANGSRMVSPTTLTIGDKVEIGAFRLGPAGNKTLFAQLVEIESEGKARSGLPSFGPSNPVSTLPSLSGLKP